MYIHAFIKNVIYYMFFLALVNYNDKIDYKI